MADVQVSGGSCSIGLILFLVFLVLKLTGVIAWSWWWVTCPLWIGLAVILGVLGIMLVCVSIAALCGGR